MVRTRWIRNGLGRLVAIGLLFLAAPHALADGPARGPQGEDGFARFCEEWMEKLAARERDNLSKVQFRAGQAGVIAEYVGYGRAALKCDSRVKKPGIPGVGVLVYHELRYRKQGADAARARASEPEVVDRVEITEVFKYDGSRWAY
jgi:hypothetical protein